jgi:hypothetical protein
MLFMALLGVVLFAPAVGSMLERVFLMQGAAA